ncbi:MAG: C4-type zinc ribbon domain-containing protein [Eubacteriales bacterium]|nr:C4-type zinc ribbon domain-containing protein [Eubacteriales bacterium]
MEKLALLYEYQQADAELEAYEKKLKNTATRKQLIKLQSYLKKQQEALRDMENKALVEQNGLSEVEAQYDRMIELLNKKHKDIGEYEKMDPEELDYNVVKDLVHEYETTYENIVKQKRRAVIVQKNAEQTAAKLKDILVHVSQAQKDFATLKKKHEEELRAGAEELDKLRKAAELAASKVDAELLKKYKRIKKNTPMPVTLLQGGRCMGCNMELPSRDLANIKKTDTIIECENCGRILYLQ